jgi:hypothetical protein
MPTKDSRAGQLNAVIDPKLLFLARTAARYKGLSLVEFIEDAFRLALSPESVDGDEPSYGPEFRPKQDAQLRFEHLWHEDDVTRLFKVGMTDRNLLAPKQRAIYDHVVDSLIKQGKKVTLKNCVGCIDTSERD